MIDTLRVLVDWKCNLACPYCCNEQPEVRAAIRPVTLEEIDFSRYRVVCITGGEPLLFPERIQAVCARTPFDALRVLYTNGTLLTPAMGAWLQAMGIDAINVGLHAASSFHPLIRRSIDAWPGRIRFNVEDRQQWVKEAWRNVDFRFWRRDDCARPNEDRVVLEWCDEADAFGPVALQKESLEALHRENSLLLAS